MALLVGEVCKAPTRGQLGVGSDNSDEEVELGLGTPRHRAG